MTTVSVLRDLRHACSGCGACCQGSIVHLVDQAEVDAVIAQGAALGVADPVEEGHLRLTGGACAFLGEDRRCRIHAAYGLDAKPLVCRQFPFVLVQTEDGVRAGIDPASTAWRTSRLHGPALHPPRGARARPAPRDPSQAAIERQLVTLCHRDGARLADLLGVLCAAPDAPPDLPPGFAARWIQIVRDAPLAELLHHPAVGPDHRDTLLPLLAAAKTTAPAPPPLSPTVEADAMALIGDALWLRLVTRIPMVQATALLLAGGVLLAGWADPEPDAFGRALATWCRVLRAGPFWQAMVPTPARLQWLATGE